MSQLELAKQECFKNKVLFVIDTLEVGGAELSLLDNLSHFKNIIPVVCHIYKGDSLKDKFLERKIKVYSINLGAKYGFSEAYRRLKEIVQFENPALLVAYLTRSELITRVVGYTSKKMVIGTFVSDLYSKAYNKRLSFLSNVAVWFFKMANKLTAGICSGFIANSFAIKNANAVHLNIPDHKITVINRGRNSDLYMSTNKMLNVKRLKFVSVGRLVALKDTTN
jgi:hypothetical protein